MMAQPLSGSVVLAGSPRPVSALALGTVAYRLAEAERWFEVLDAFRAAGGTLIDTARVYAGGESEQVVGRWLEARAARDDMLLLTKCAHGDALLPADDFEAVVTRELATSLEALRTDYVDLYMLHRDNPAVPVGRILERLNRVLAEGHAGAIGASNWAYARVDEANAYAQAHGLRGFTFVSNNLSLAVPREPFYPRLVSVDAPGEQWHRRTGIPLLSWSSQARGFFVGDHMATLRAQAGGPSTPFDQRMMAVYGSDANFERLRRAQALGEVRGGYTAVEVALAWLLHKPYPLVPIVGPRSRDELASCVKALGLRLSDADCRWLNLEG